MRSGGQRYRKRRPLPAFLLILVLGIAATIVWLRVMDEDSKVTAAAHCAPPPTPTSAATPGEAVPTLGKPLEPDALDRTWPVAPSTAQVRVVNGSSQRGLATLVTESLRALGFSQVADPGNDTIYGDKMTCRAQIRFGAQGTSAARTISLLEPCAELVRDERQDATVDVVLGDKFDDLHPNQAAKTLIEQLNDLAKQEPPVQGGLQAAPKTYKVDTNLMAAARKVNC